MAKNEPKTKPSGENPLEVIARVEHTVRRNDAMALHDVYCQITQQPAVVWGGRIIAFGEYQYESDRSNCAGTWMRAGFAVSKSKLTLYLMAGFDDCAELLAKLGKHKTGVCCLYINKLTDLDMTLLDQIISDDYQRMQQRYPQ